MNRPDLTLVLACYNEESIFNESIEEIIRTLEQTKFSFEILFVDDKSSDKTAQLIRDACRRYLFCRGLFHSKNKGRGATVTDGILASRGYVVGYIDIDLEVSPLYIPLMIRWIREDRADVIIGRRVYRTSIGSLPREIFSVGYQKLSRFLVDTGGFDTETGYKFFNRKKILPILKQATHPHWFWDTEIIVYGKRAGLRIAEIPVLFIRRFDKKSSVRVLRDILDYTVSLWGFRKKLKSA